MEVTQTACIFAILLAAVTLVPSARADERGREYAPEIDAFHSYSNGTRLFLLADTTKTEGRETWQNEVGVHLDVSTRRARRERVHLADWDRARTVGLRIGYRQLRVWEDERGDIDERRGIAELTLRGSLPNQFLLTHRLGFDQREIRGNSSQRYRYRLTLERELTAGHVLLVPYAQVELSYDTRYSAWSRQRYQLGAEIEITKHWRLEPYLAVDKDVEPVTFYTDRIGLAAKFYW